MPSSVVTAAEDKARQLEAGLAEAGLFHPHRWRVSPEPFPLAANQVQFLEELGGWLLSFYQAANRLYFASLQGRQPTWISRWLDQGKTEQVLEYGRMNRFRTQLPGVIRPDLILTDRGFTASELDSVPGGIGDTACMARLYQELGYQPVGCPPGMVEGFADFIRFTAEKETPSLAIVISDESADYRPEMRWLADRLRERGLACRAVIPQQVVFTEDGLLVEGEWGREPVDVLYRFFELFDLKNIPKAELILYAARKRKVALTPPAKAYLEEKMLLALCHHPALAGFWRRELGEEVYQELRALFPPTWVVDPQPVPPHALIPGLEVGGTPVQDWRQLGDATQKERQLVLKPSGFSELAWGSRGVSVGEDLPQERWRAALEQALESFPRTPYVLQEFRKGSRVSVRYWDDGQAEIREMEGRVRLSPYYFVIDGQAKLGGTLATICPADKKLIHGMTDAVMTVC